MADIRINALATTAVTTASDDFFAIDGTTNGTRKMSAYNQVFSGTLTIGGAATIGGTITDTLSTAGDTFFSAKASGDSVARFAAQASGLLQWGSGSGAVDVSLYRTSANNLRTGSNFIADGTLTVSSTTDTTSSTTGALIITGGVGVGKSLYVADSITIAGSSGILGSGSGSLNLTSGSSQSILLKTNGGTTALTLDSSQNATFAGAPILNDSTAGFYLGPINTDGTWRIIRSGTNLLMQRRESGVYVTKSTISS